MTETKARSAHLTLDAISAVLMIVAAVVLVALAIARPRESDGAAAAGAEPPLPTYPLDLATAITRGNPNAPIAVLEFVDFECPYCASFAQESMPLLLKSYVDSGKVLLALRHLPLERIHLSAFRMAEVATCAARQSQFWALHDRFFGAFRGLQHSDLVAHARALGINSQEFIRCAEGGATAHVRRDISLAQELEVGGTPVFFIGTLSSGTTLKVTKRVSGNNFRTVRAELDRLIGSAAK